MPLEITPSTKLIIPNSPIINLAVIMVIIANTALPINDLLVVLKPKNPATIGTKISGSQKLAVDHINSIIPSADIDMAIETIERSTTNVRIRINLLLSVIFGNSTFAISFVNITLVEFSHDSANPIIAPIIPVIINPLITGGKLLMYRNNTSLGFASGNEALTK